mmetsp:Transcript_36480/g.78949  ORF Transcript_36480/g.78949 Transcript_36480/m.78949 type:complete len:83 (+) Transcript_36480:240-488(+)
MSASAPDPNMVRKRRLRSAWLTAALVEVDLRPGSATGEAPAEEGVLGQQFRPRGEAQEERGEGVAGQQRLGDIRPGEGETLR